MGIAKPNHLCVACRRAKVIMQTISFIHEGHLYRTNVLVCTNKSCVEKRGGIVVEHHVEKGRDNMNRNASGVVA